MQDGVYRFRSGDGKSLNVAIIKEGESYHIFDYGSRNISRSLSVSEVNRVIAEYWRTGNTANAESIIAQSQTKTAPTEMSVPENNAQDRVLNAKNAQNNVDNNQNVANLDDNAAKSAAYLGALDKSAVMNPNSGQIETTASNIGKIKKTIKSAVEKIIKLKGKIDDKFNQIRITRQRKKQHL